jgi:hypothetical protein
MNNLGMRVHVLGPSICIWGYCSTVMAWAVGARTPAEASSTSCFGASIECRTSLPLLRLLVEKMPAALSRAAQRFAEPLLFHKSTVRGITSEPK